MPRSKTPRTLKAIAGTIQPCRDIPQVELPVIAEIPPAPDWLPNAHAIREWDRLAPILVANKLLTQAGLSAFGLLCAQHGKMVQLFLAGESPNAAMLASYRNLINDFGLTPVAQGKVKLGAPAQEKGNAFANNGQRRAA